MTKTDLCLIYKRMPYVYKITYPNGKIYIGSDMTDSYNYCGSPRSQELMEYLKSIKDDIIIHKQILKDYPEGTITEQELHIEEKKFILEYKSNNPEIGYNKKT